MESHALSRDRAVEHPADAGTVEIGGGDALKLIIRRVKMSITTMTQ